MCVSLSVSDSLSLSLSDSLSLSLSSSFIHFFIILFILHFSDPQRVLSRTFTSRTDRLTACMDYDYGMGFVIVKINSNHNGNNNNNGNNINNNDNDNQAFSLVDICASSDEVEFSNVISRAIPLKKGKYAVIPYTHAPVKRAVEYSLLCQYVQADILFDDEKNDENIDIKNIKKMKNKKIKKISAEKREMILEAVIPDGPVILPKLADIRIWEYIEDTEEKGD